MANKVEKRTVRIEDWLGNVYIPETAATAESGGDTIINNKYVSYTIIVPDPTPVDPNIPDGEKPEPEPGTGGITDGEIVPDSEASDGTSIHIIAHPTEERNLIITNIEGLPFGEIAINIRMKAKYVLSAEQEKIDLIRVETYWVDASSTVPVDSLLDKKIFSTKSFPENGKYTTLSMSTNYHGRSDVKKYYMKIKIIVLPGTGAEFWYDQLRVAVRMDSPDIIKPTPGGEGDEKVYQQELYVEAQPSSGNPAMFTLIVP